ncbi:MAG TPA: hypothetical protein VMX94_12835 [Armatimonadota bacterium]|nr:hypothetical protein [Armatimonadota bacterium]
MTNARTWPSRRLQLTIMAVLLLGAALRVFWQPLNKEARAEKLYLDSWFGNGWNMFEIGDYPRAPEAAIGRLEAALRLSPGNSLYEQALVWQYPRQQLPRLLEERKLGVEARGLAAGLIYERREEASPAANVGEKLRRLDALAKSDPSNALVHYRKAFALQEAGRPDEAYAEIKIANRLGAIRLYFPEATEPVLDALYGPAVYALPFPDMAKLRHLARAQVGSANERLRQGKAGEACEILESTCRMGVNTASTEPPSIISVLVGKAVFAIAVKPLQPIYKDFGMKEKLAAMQRVDGAFERGFQSCLSPIDFSFEKRFAVALAIPLALALAHDFCASLMVVFLLLWVLPTMVRKRRKESALAVPPWSEGWLARTFVAIYVPALAIVLGMVFLWWPSVSPLSDTSLYLLSPGLIAVVILAQAVVLGAVLRILHHRYDEHTGERTGILRFVFKAPAAAKAWTRKYLIAGLAGQLSFLVCCLLLATIVYKPIFGGHPWEAHRFRILNESHERAVARGIARDLKASLTNPHVRE